MNFRCFPCLTTCASVAVSDQQLGVLVGAALAAAAILLMGWRRLPRRLDATVAVPPPRTHPRDVVLRDAAYLVRRHLAGEPTSRRKSGLGDQAWRRAMHLCRSAELCDHYGWHVEDYPSALARLQAARRGHVDLARKGTFVEPYD